MEAHWPRISERPSVQSLVNAYGNLDCYEVLVHHLSHLAMRELSACGVSGPCCTSLKVRTPRYVHFSRCLDSWTHIYLDFAELARLALRMQPRPTLWKRSLMRSTASGRNRAAVPPELRGDRVGPVVRQDYLVRGLRREAERRGERAECREQQAEGDEDALVEHDHHNRGREAEQ